MVGVAPTAPGNVTFSLRIRHYDGNGNLVTQGVATTIVGPGGAGAVGSALDYIVPDPYTPNYSVTLELFSSEDGLLDAKSCTFSSD